jgi:hypothetical protein
VRLATEYERIHASGAEVIAISVDDEARQAGMARRWGLTHTRMVSDPGGERYLRPLDFFDPEERGGIALPGIVVVEPGGSEVARFRSRDFADRTHDDDLYEVLTGLGLPAVDPEPWTPDVAVPEDLSGYFRPEEFGAYFRGNRFGALAIAQRVEDAEARSAAREHHDMAKAMLGAWQEWRTHLS